METLKVNNNFFNVKNQYLFSNSKYICFQSYNTIMLEYDIVKGVIKFNTNEYNYTTTTNKYLGKVLEYIYYLTYSNEVKKLLDSKNRKKDILSLKQGVMNIW